MTKIKGITTEAICRNDDVRAGCFLVYFFLLFGSFYPVHSHLYILGENISYLASLRKPEERKKMCSLRKGLSRCS
ncbi:MAG TPA: hypothetical protein VGO47_02790 [Chlamydiales bacterium]|nr:hypothetical protein [Chlamydiales bacterium]